MKKLQRAMLLIIGIVLFLGFSLQAKEAKLDKGEKKFRQVKSYTLKDFHFNWSIIYMDIVSFHTNESDGKHFTLPERVTFYTSLKVGQTDKFIYRRQAWLAKAISKPDYFWKKQMHPSSIYVFASMRFLEEGDRRFKAITEIQDIRDMFGRIDTEAELRVWIMATDQYAIGIHSYKKTARGYRVRFKAKGLGCHYREYFDYYDQQGKLLRTKVLKSYRIKKCSPIML